MNTRLMTFILLVLTTQASYSQDMQESWQLLIKQHAGLQAQKMLVDAEVKQLAATKWLRGPQLDFKWQFNHLNDDVALDIDISMLNPLALPIHQQIQNQNFTSAQLVATLPIATGGKISAAIDAQRGAIAVSKSEQQFSAQTLFLVYVERYLQYDLARESVEIRRQSFASQQQHLNSAIKQEEQGVIAYSQRLQVEVELEEALRDFKSAESNFRLAGIAFDKLFQSKVSRPFSSFIPLSDIEIDQQYLINNITDQHPAFTKISGLQQQVRAADQIVASSFLPQVALFANYELLPNDLTAFQPRWATGVSVQWNLLSGKNRRLEIASQDAKLGALMAKNRQLKNDMIILVQQKMESLNQAKFLIASLDASKTLARENLKLKEKALAQGLATTIEWNDAQLMLVGIQLKRNRAIYDQYMALANIYVLTGSYNAYFQLIGEL